MNIYFILNKDINKIKIGYSSKLYNRIKTLQTGNSSELIFIGMIMNCDKTMERAFHLHFKQQHEKLEWFRNEGKLNRFLHIIFSKESIFDCDKNSITDYLIDNNFSF